MSAVIIWWLVVEIVGLAALPVAWRLFGSLADRGYAFAKPLGIFLVSYILWVLALFGIVKNTRETVVFIVAALTIVSWWWVTRRPVAVAEAATVGTPRKQRRVSTTAAGARVHKARRAAARPLEAPEILTWLRANVRIVAAEEAIFLFGLLVWAFFKAYNPEIVATEKPMELAFLNAILRSEQLPPYDPWLSGYAISYYYMGYLMMAVLTRLSGLASTITFNLTTVLTFALTLTGAFSIVYNLATARRPMLAASLRVAAGALAAAFVALLGNLQGVLEALYAHGFGSQAFWRSVDIADMTQPYVSQAWYPTTNWWWWKATRVIATQGAIGDYTISEFPFFSFMLGDNHPHVLSLPYVLMALGVGLTLLLGGERGLWRRIEERRWLSLAGLVFWPALLLGGLFFLNSWDLPTYTLIAVVAYALCVYQSRQMLDRDAWREIAVFAAATVGLGVVLFVPFYLAFQPPTGGFGVVRVRTQFHHFLITFGPFMTIVSGLLAVKVQEWRAGQAANGAAARRWLPFVLAGGAGVATIMFAIQAWTTVTTFLFASLSGVLVSFAVLLLMVLAVLALLAHARGNRADVFALGLALAGLLAFLGPEWLHLRDGFSGNLARMNTVFKFHYQAWLLLALASAYAVYYVLAGRGEAGTPSSISAPRLVWGVAVAAIVAGCLVYPAMAFYTKANQFQGTPTLDGAAHLQRFAPDEYSAIQWLNRNVKGAPVIVEVVGGSFSEYARISAHTGLPTVQGWGGHESQWRSTKGWEAREGDVNRIYATMDINEAKSLLRKYGVTYVYVGRLERETRGNDNQPKYSAAALGKFGQFMDVAFQQGSVTIYKWRE